MEISQEFVQSVLVHVQQLSLEEHSWKMNFPIFLNTRILLLCVKQPEVPYVQRKALKSQAQFLPKDQILLLFPFSNLMCIGWCFESP